MTISEKKIFKCTIFSWDNDFTKFYFIFTLQMLKMGVVHIYIPFTHRKKPEHKLCRLYSDENILIHMTKKKFSMEKLDHVFL